MVDRPRRRIAVFGSCSAGLDELSRASAADDLASASGSWAGSYTVVRTTADGEWEVVTDVSSACPLFTARIAGGVVWASSSRALSGLTGNRVDEEWLASYLVDKRTPMPHRSAWSGVVPVPPGHRLSVSSRHTLTVTPWWSPRQRCCGDAATGVRQALLDGVRARTEGRAVSCDLAGMDSTAIAVIAARYGPVLGVTAHPVDVTDGGDLRYARALSVPGLSRTMLSLRPRHLPFSPAGGHLPATDEPAPSSMTWAMFSDMLRRVANAGSAVHLTGDGGDNLFLPPPTHLVDLVWRGRIVRMAADAQAWARLRKVSPWPLVAAALRRDAARLARPWPTRPLWHLDAVGDREAADVPHADAALIASIRGAARPAYADCQLAEELGIELHNPYFDGAILDAVLSVPSWDRFAVHRYKPVLIDAVGDLLPELHRRRVTKGVFAEDFHQGVRVNLQRLLTLADGRLAAMGLINPGPLRAALQAAALGAKTVWPPVLATLTAEAWLEAVETAPTVQWSPTPGEGVR
ncbi:asparagine synthase (glutamine-hydrolyzing) [Streptomyces olivoverticillatus]|uniref:Asparagine synthase (Glutamine-hydrolyzing) n=2 Tax=Streptomyces olivoverticillatus TaxID=66427 RepID=A0A7W7LK72_9ACTN|nr:asparagine synthase (glutamine-hydrolyzing) [Streptomyces olivoverticillatus]